MQLLYALGIAIVLALAIRGIQLLRENRRRLRVKLEKVPPGPEIEESRYSELGKVRVRPRFGVEPTETVAAATPVRRSSVVVVPEPESEVNFAAVSAQEQDVPLLLQDASEPVVAAAPVSSTAYAISAEVPARVVAKAQPEPEIPINVPAATPMSAPPADDSIPVLLTPAAASLATETIEQHDMFADEPIMLPPSRKSESAPVPSRASVLYEKTVEPVRPVAAPAAEEKVYVDVQDVIALHVVAREHLFSGEDLLRSILAYGLRFGEMAIFHRHEQPTGQGRILFSMAKAVEPGTFDLEAMTGEDIPGVSFFLSLPGINSIHAYDIMVDTVKRLATELNGEILDEQQQVLTRQLIEHYRERVQEFERRRLMNRPPV